MAKNESLTGWAFPPHFSSGKEVYMVSGEEDIRQSLRVLFSTTLGERLFMPDFGCDMEPFLFQSVSAPVVSRIENMITHAVNTYETRIALDDISVLTDEISDGKLKISVSYTILETDKEDEMSYTYNL